ncbi:carboxypeptidase-like regulatory domain-containing protein [Bordetella avium]|uniref:Exported protein n=1 Tax=Bordetella avium (strain 197N) TaxID=360910 RepID=Q2KZV2_BORA1|nr:carboxypeptidase-like regulatory domain-containing protein [Bordetella avium]AZY49343.1 carboxypeptidase regulatory-like domain-containing protein [Bordetella avium]AZY52696.1 carboxypeptidase regulatory-like domain-containing protein [Bordetella avium]RIQ12821.1 carboxypeptidase regulatory-like domain-containing protein [Bordetella avium]RIQ19143.1 carboxypeptidase regulatory-like domain-containing protein [Bordetella avium]RIQ32055.1 carboxypeptidase regulatory-like domain-containing prot
MKKIHERSLLAALLMAGAMTVSGAALAQDLPLLPQTQQQGDVQFLSGGIGDGQSGAIKAAASKYRLMLTFVQRGPGGVGEYLADIPVDIVNAKGQSVLKTVAQGPFLLANLPAGSYTVKASSNGAEKSTRVTIGKSGTARAIFEWR